MIDFIVIRVSDDDQDVAEQESTYTELLKIYDSLDHKGKVSMLACAYMQKLRVKSQQRGQA